MHLCLTANCALDFSCNPHNLLHESHKREVAWLPLEWSHSIFFHDTEALAFSSHQCSLLQGLSSTCSHFCPHSTLANLDIDLVACHMGLTFLCHSIQMQTLQLQVHHRWQSGALLCFSSIAKPNTNSSNKLIAMETEANGSIFHAGCCLVGTEL